MRSGKFIRGARLLLPALAAFLMPKCPMCIAGYVALGTGLAVSISAAESLRLALLGGAQIIFAFYLVKEFQTKESSHETVCRRGCSSESERSLYRAQFRRADRVGV